MLSSKNRTNVAKSSGSKFYLPAMAASVIAALLALFCLLLPLTVILAGGAGFLWYKFVGEQYSKIQHVSTEAEFRAKRDQDAILRLMDELAEFSNGDLTVEAQVTEDFTGAIADSVNYAIESMRELVGTINRT